MAHNSAAVQLEVYRRSFTKSDPSLIQVSLDVTVLDRYLGLSGYSITRTDTVGRIKREGGWTLDFGIADEDRTVHVSLENIFNVLPEGERGHWAEHVVTMPLSHNFLKMQLSPNSCIDDGEIRDW